MNTKQLSFLFSIVVMSLMLLSCSAQAQREDSAGDDVMNDEFFEGNTNAPEFPRGMDWLNTDTPIQLADLKGKLVLLDFWTFCCINCMHVIPDLKKLEEKYADELVVIGVHSAKFTNEQGSEAIRQAILRYGIEHPVVNDKDFRIWNSYGVHAWPSFVLINPKGKIIGVHSGENIFEPFDSIIGNAVKYFSSKNELKRGKLDLALENRNMPNTLLAFPGKISSAPKSKRLIITDSNNDRILITTPKGEILEVIGSGRQGQSDGSFEQAEFFHPQGTCLDGDILYIADTENHTIRKANLKTRTVETILGCGQQANFHNQAGMGTDVCLNSPWDLVKVGDKLYIAMAGPHQLWEADLNTLEAKPYAGSAREARIDGPLLQAALAQPSGITTDGKKLYFADSEVSSIRSADLDPKGRVETIIGEDLFEYGDIDGGRDKARLQHPLGVTYYDGKLYVADTYNSKIKIIDPVKKTSYTYAGTGQSGFHDGKLSEAQFYEPGGLTVLDGRIYVADVNNHAIRVIDMQAGTVGTLEFSGLNKLEVPLAEDEDDFDGRMVELDKVSLSAGQDAIKLNLLLPDGYKFIEDAPFALDYNSSNPDYLKFTTAPEDIEFNGKTIPLSIPVMAVEGNSEVSLETSVYFCNKKSGVCMIDNLRIKVPVEITTSGTSEISLNVDIEPKQ